MGQFSSELALIQDYHDHIENLAKQTAKDLFSIEIGINISKISIFWNFIRCR